MSPSKGALKGGSQVAGPADARRQKELPTSEQDSPGATLESLNQLKHGE